MQILFKFPTIRLTTEIIKAWLDFGRNSQVALLGLWIAIIILLWTYNRTGQKILYSSMTFFSRKNSRMAQKFWNLTCILKPNYFKEQCSSSSFLLTWSRFTGPKWPWSLRRLVPCLKWMELGCQVLLGHFGHVYLLQVSKKDDEERCF